MQQQQCSSSSSRDSSSKAAAAAGQQQQGSISKAASARQQRQGSSSKAAAGAGQHQQGSTSKAAAAARQQRQGSRSSNTAAARQQQQGSSSSSSSNKAAAAARGSSSSKAAAAGKQEQQHSSGKAAATRQQQQQQQQAGAATRKQQQQQAAAAATGSSSSNRQQQQQGSSSSKAAAAGKQQQQHSSGKAATRLQQQQQQQQGSSNKAARHSGKEAAARKQQQDSSSKTAAARQQRQGSGRSKTAAKQSSSSKAASARQQQQEDRSGKATAARQQQQGSRGKQGSSSKAAAARQQRQGSSSKGAAEQAGAQPAPKPAAKPAAKPAPKPGAAPSADEREREARQKAVQAAEAAALLRAEAEQKEAARVAEVRAQRIVTQAVAAELIRKNDEKRKAAEAERAEVWRRTATPSAKPASRAPEAKAGKRKPSVKLVVKKPAGLGRQGAASNRSGEGSTTVSSPSCVILVDSPSKGGAGGVSSPVSPAILVPQAATGRGCSNPSRAASARPAGGRQEAALPPLQRMTRSGWKTVGSPGRKPPHVSEGRKAEAAQPTASKPTSKAVTTAQQRQGPGEAASRRAATAAPQKAGGRAPPPQEDRRGDRPLCREFNSPGGCSRQPCRFRHVPTPACIEALTALGCRRAGCRHRHVAACDIEGCDDAACEAAHPQDPRLMGRLPRRWEPVDGVSSTFSPPQATGSSPVAARFQAAPVAPWAFSRQLPEPPAAPTERSSSPAEAAPEWRWDSPFDPGEALLLKEEELRAAIRAARAWGNMYGTCVRYMEAGLKAHAAGALVLSQEYEAQKAQMTREGKEREGIALEEARQWPRRSLHLQVGEREGRRDVAFLEAAEATEALAQMKEDKERRLALALAALAIKKDPPGPPGCDVLMGSQRPEADPPQPGEHKDPGSDAPMGEAQGPGPDLRRLSGLGRSTERGTPRKDTQQEGEGDRSATRSLGRGGDDLTVDGCVEPHPGPAAPPPPAPAAPPPVCLCGRLPGVQGRHRNMCPLSRAYRPDAAPAAPPANNHRRRAPAAGQAADPAAGPAHAAFEEEMPFSFAEISALAVPKLERIPLDAQLVVAAQLAKALQLAATGSVTGWLRLHSFATLVLFKPRRGGRKKVAAALRSRCPSPPQTRKPALGCPAGPLVDWIDSQCL
ncbi:hypothetical protein DIPPA_32572 [Diplonema papillatum]|nr:hypothetical protein DIPPA_32572 [Diplonema papillatum]